MCPDGAISWLISFLKFQGTDSFHGKDLCLFLSIMPTEQPPVFSGAENAKQVGKQAEKGALNLAIRSNP